VAGLQQLKVPIPNNPVGYVLPYLFEVPGGLAIIDPGWDAPESIDSLRDQLAELGASFTDLRQIVVTHVHPDHYGMAGKLREASGASIAVHEKELDWIHNRPAVMAQSRSWLALHGMPVEQVEELATRNFRRFLFDDAEPDRTMSDNESIRLGRFELQAVWTPGHAPGHVCFYIEDLEFLLSGDHVLPTISPNVSYRAGMEGDPLGDYLQSLQRLRGFKVKRVWPAHEYAFDDLNQRLDELQEHHRLRIEEMLDAVEAGADSVYEVARRVKWAVGHFDKLNLWTQQAAMNETLAHLNHLVLEKRLEQHESEARIRYAIA
jgi:glyoxylase-like metal-dependent hydrolase (beta-lactamase superfamily II)